MVGGKRQAPSEPKIYHITPVDRLSSIIADGCLWSDAEVRRRESPGTTIGLPGIKRRRLEELTLTSHPDLYVGQCVPFYFCPRSVMLYKIHKANDPELTYREGQGPIVHLQADVRAVVEWADAHQRRWAFTLSNAGSYYFEDRCDLSSLSEVDWDAVEARTWAGAPMEWKQAEFLLEREFPWDLIEFIGVHSPEIRDRVRQALETAGHQPIVQVAPRWYY